MADGKLTFDTKIDNSGFEKGIGKLGSIAKTGLKATAGAMAAAAGGAAGAIVALTKTAVSNYAEYEQLVGGVETLFKDSASKVQEYANNAYKTAGLSANEYMDTVTSFSASLLQSLDGDTAAAAEKANLAITDMADNANKMGTSMESIQNAYQGFAKANYTMLDNLKLGYGGTKEEMERLLKDAQKLSGVKYDISSYSDIVDAIHVVQTEMGITGTTAKEAATTIQGSIASLGAAWSNFLTGMADENSDFDQLLGNLIESAITVVENLVPRILETVPRLMDGLTQLVESLATELPGMLSELLPVFMEAVNTLAAALLENIPLLVNAGIELINGLIQGLSDNAETIINAAIEIVGALAEGIIELLPQLGELALQIIQELTQALVENLPTLVPAAVELIADFVEWCLDNIDLIIDCGCQIIAALVEGIINSLPILIEKGPEIIVKLSEAIDNAAVRLIECGIQIISMLVSGISQMISKAVKAAEDVVSGISQKLNSKISEFTDIGKNFIKGIINGITGSVSVAVNAAKRLGSSIVGGIKNVLGIRSPSRVMKRMFEKDFTDGIVIGIDNGGTRVQGAVRAMSEAAISTAKEFSDDYKELGENYTELIGEGIDDKIDELIETAQEVMDELNSKVDKKNKEAFSKEGKELMAVYKKVLEEGAEEAKEAINKKIKSITEEWQKQRDNILSEQDDMQKKLASYGDDLFSYDENKNMVLTNIEANIDALERYDEALTALKDRGISDEFMSQITDMSVDDGTMFAEKLNAMSDEQLVQYEQAWQTQQEKAKEIAEKFYAEQLNTLDAEYSQKLDEALADIPEMVEEIGKNTAKGLADGMLSEKGYVSNAAQELVDIIMSTLKDGLEIASPSKWAKRVIGKNVALGIGKGFDDTMPEIEKDIQDSLDALSEIKVAVGASDYRSPYGENVVKKSSSVKETNTTTIVREKVVDVRFKGTMGSVARLLKPYIDDENDRKGPSL